MRNKKKRNDYAQERGQRHSARLCRLKKGRIGPSRRQP
jgi:hypothetical protein